ncbi:MAG TPA: polysaccharide biosynthesis tyrosine autokinase [Stellaceae bacterium]|nr:polysaccharide biosynthesis tyrosine autokinase [Stellaceae bacterium]
MSELVEPFPSVPGGRAGQPGRAPDQRSQPGGGAERVRLRPVSGGEGGPEGDLLDLREILNILRRRRMSIIGTALAVTALVFVIIFQLTPRYTAEALILVDARKTQVMDVQAVVSGINGDLSAMGPAIRSEVEVMNSNTLAERVATKLDLMNNPEFNGALKPPGFFAAYNPIHLIPDDYLLAVGLVKPEVQLTEEAKRQRLLTRIAGALSGHMNITNDGRSTVIRVAAQSESPGLAATIANTYAEMYLTQQLEDKFEAAQRVNAWLNERTKELRDKVQESDHAVQFYREQNSLTEAKGFTVTEQQLSELNSQLILASSDRAAKDANLRQIQDMLKGQGGADAAAQVLASPLISNLTQQEATARQNRAELATRYKPDHPAMINALAQEHDIQKKIGDEVAKVVRGMANDAVAARARESSLRASLAELQRSAGVLDKAQVRLADLQREADANRTLYQDFLSRFKQTSAQNDLEMPDARLVARASIPEAPSFPKRTLFGGMGVMLGLLIGVFVAFALERLDNGFRNADQLEKLGGVATLGMTPNLFQKESVIDTLVNKPTSQYAEAIRSIRATLRYSNIDNPPKIVLVTSSLPEEGKTLFACSLARSTARSGKKALLIDCDLRRPSVGRAMGVAANSEGPGIVGLFEDNPVQDIIKVDQITGMHYIPSPRGALNPQDLLGSHHMRMFLESKRAEYDLIVIDAPPVLAVSDAIVLSHLVDSTIFLIRWERTPRPVALGALKALRANGGHVSGAVLSRVNVRKHALYGYGDHAYYYGHYSNYYS